MTEPWIDIDEHLEDAFYECRFRRRAYGLLRYATDGRGADRRLIIDGQTDPAEVSFDEKLDVLWFHMLADTNEFTPRLFDTLITRPVDLVWAIKADIDFNPFTDFTDWSPYWSYVSESIGQANAARWNITPEDLPNEYRFGVLRYSFSLAK